MLSLLELIAYTFTADSPAVLNAIALFVVFPAPPSFILLTKLIPSNVFLLPSTTTVSSSVAITANPFFTFLDVIVPCAKSLALSTSVSPIAEAVVASVALVVSSAFVVASVALVVSSAFVVASVTLVVSSAFVVASVTLVVSSAFVVASVALVVSSEDLFSVTTAMKI